MASVAMALACGLLLPARSHAQFTPWTGSVISPSDRRGAFGIFDTTWSVYSTDRSTGALERTLWSDTDGWVTVPIDPVPGGLNGCSGHGSHMISATHANYAGGTWSDIYYASADGRSLRHAWHTGARSGGFGCETIESLPSPPPYTPPNWNGFIAHPSALVVNGVPHVFYRSGTSLRAATWNGAWSTATIDPYIADNGEALPGQWNEGTEVSSILWPDGTWHVFYRDSVNGDLKQAWFDGQGFQIEVLDGNGVSPNFYSRTSEDVGMDLVTVAQGNNRHVFYRATSQNDVCPADSPYIRHAYYRGATGTWSYSGFGCNHGHGMSAAVFGSEWRVYSAQRNECAVVEHSGLYAYPSSARFVDISSSTIACDPTRQTSAFVDPFGYMNLFYTLRESSGYEFTHAWR